jgi:pyruvate,water dikinase
VIQAGTLPTASMSEVLFTRVYNMVRRKGDPEATALLFGFDTSALLAEKSLFDLGQWAKARPALREYALHAPVENLAADLRSEQPPQGVPVEDWAEWKSRFEKHLASFGHTSYEFDFVNPTPAEMPETLLDALSVHRSQASTRTSASESC